MKRPSRVLVLANLLLGVQATVLGFHYDNVLLILAGIIGLVGFSILVNNP